MSDLSALSAISGLNGLSERDSYYQYLINNNSTSTMLNALSGDSSDSDSSGLSGISNLLSQTSGLTGTASSSLTGISNLLGSSSGDSDGSSLSALTSFSQILKTYLSSEQTEAASMAKNMSNILEEADTNGEDTGSVTYKTVQELYKYFTEKANAEGKSNILTASGSSSNTTSASQVQSGASAQLASTGEFDFDDFENNVDQNIEASMELSGSTL